MIFLYPGNEQVKQHNITYISIPKIKYLGINLTKIYKIYLRKTTYKTLMNKIEEKVKKWRALLGRQKNSVLSRCGFFPS